MRNLKPLIIESEERGLTQEQIGAINYCINEGGEWELKDGRVNVVGNIRIYSTKAEKLRGILWGRIEGSFDYHGEYNVIFPNCKDLKNGPTYVKENYLCSNSGNLMLLEGAPTYIGGIFSLSYTNLQSLRGMPKIPKWEQICAEETLISEDGIQAVAKWVNNDLSFDDAVLVSFSELKNKNDVRILLDEINPYLLTNAISNHGDIMKSLALIRNLKPAWYYGWKDEIFNKINHGDLAADLGDVGY